MNHLSNQALDLNLRTLLANKALELADALIAKQLAIFHNQRKHTAEDDSDALSQDVEDAINNEFDIRGDMHMYAQELSLQLR